MTPRLHRSTVRLLSATTIVLVLPSVLSAVLPSVLLSVLLWSAPSTRHPAAAKADAPMPDKYQFTIRATDALGLIRDATDMDVGPDGSLYVLDAVSARVQRLMFDRTVISVWGDHGAAPGMFKDPVAISVGADGDVYVADAGNGRVQRFDPAGRFKAAWSLDRLGDLPVGMPAGVAVGLDGTVLVSDRTNSVIARYSPDGALIGWFGQSGPASTTLDGPTQLATGPDGTLYVIDERHNRIVRYTSEGRILNMITPRGLLPAGSRDGNPVDINVSADGTVCAADGRQVHHFTASLIELGRTRTDELPTSVAFAPNGETYLGVRPAFECDYRTHPFLCVGLVVVRLDLRRQPGFAAVDQGRLVGLRSAGSAPGQFGRFPVFRPPRVTLFAAADGRVVAGDSGSRRVQVFDSTGVFEWAGDDFEKVTPDVRESLGVAAAPDGSIWVADAAGGQLVAYDAVGQFLLKLRVVIPPVRPRTGVPIGVVVKPDRTMIAMNSANGGVVHVDRFGRVLAEWGDRLGSGEADYYGCSDIDTGPEPCNAQPIALSNDGETLFALDGTHGRVQRFTTSGQHLGNCHGITAQSHYTTSAQALTVGPDDTVYVSDTATRGVVRFGPSGDLVGRLEGMPGRHPRLFDWPGGLAASPDGLLYVADPHNDRVLVYGPTEPDYWRVEFFGNPWLTEHVLRVANVNGTTLSWEGDPPGTPLPGDNWSARFTRDIHLSPGRHTYEVRASGGIRLWLGDDLLIDEWGSHVVLRSGTFIAPEDDDVQVRLEYVDHGVPAPVRLEFDLPLAPTATTHPEASPSPTAWPTATGGTLLFMPSLENDE